MRRLLLAFLAVGTLSAHAEFATSKYDFRFSPIGLLVGSINLNLDYAISPYWTLGPELNYWHVALGDISGYDYKIDSYGIGARANWFANGAYVEGLYVGPSLTYANVQAKYSGVNSSFTDNGTASVSTFLLGALVGYAWFWESFNIMLGAGGKVGLNTDQVKVTHSDGSSESTSTRISGLALEFSLGWTF